MMTLRELIREGEEILRQAGVPDAGHDARILFLDTFHMTSAEYVYSAGNTPERTFSAPESVTAERMRIYRDRIRMRAERIPLQQILGTAAFMGLDFRVNAFTLCPRPDTEILVEKVLKDTEGQQLKLLDLCTGTGCIGISLGILGSFTGVTLTDLSEKALETARFNAENLGAGKPCSFRLYQGDLFDALPAGFACDVIVSNPPYIPEKVIDTLEPEVRDYEPRMALSGGRDGLEIYRRLIAEAPETAPALYLEIGYDQAEAVSGLMEEAGYRGIRVIKDYGGRDRVVAGHV